MEQQNQTEQTGNLLIDVVSRFPDEQSCRVAKGALYKCGKCQKQFSVRVGTIFEDSALPLQKWFFAIFILTAHRKGLSSLQLHRDIGVTQKTAWFMLHRIRYAIKTKSFNKPLDGIVEADESYVGGKSHGVTGRGAKGMTPVFGAIQRGGDVMAQPIKKANAKTIQPIMRKHISPEAVIITDEWHAYRNLEDSFDSHETVNHGNKEYVRGDIHTNTIENFWSHLKRGLRAIQHAVSKRHLHRYVDEYAYRFNSRRMTDYERFTQFFQRCSGRLTYSELIS
jgi:transposase-like protein